MGKKILCFIFILVVILGTYQSAFAANDITQNDIAEGLLFCKDYPVSLQVNGSPVAADVPPIIVKERTLIPARAVFENMGAVVNWNEDARLVEVSMGSSVVQLTIDSKTAFVNGQQASMDVPAMIIESRTLIPVRFVAEALTCDVGWDDLNRIVKIDLPQVDTKAEITEIISENLNDKYRLTISAKNEIKNYKSFAYDEPSRFGIDIKSANLPKDIKASILSNEIFSGVRYSQFDENTVRVVADLKEKNAGKVSISEDGKSIYIDFIKNHASEYEKLGDVTVDGLDVIDWRATGKLVVIDPGHGGRDTGSQAKSNGTVILNEKDVNIDVATRLNIMLKAAGVNTYILREGDESLTLYERPALANEANGDLYISVHNNSSVNTKAKGVEVYYYSKENESNYGIYSKELAELIQKQMVSSLGLNDRKAKSEPAYAVLNKTKMPAIIIEGAFISNAEDLALMQTDAFRQQYAYITAKSIIEVLNKSVLQE